jgi:anti-sigma-K factor RskA
MTDHQYWDELAAGYALHGLAADEEILFIDHLDTCEICAASVSDHEMVAAQLGAIAHYREQEDDVPSWESMRDSILDTPRSAIITDLGEHRRRRYDVSRRTLSAAAALVVVAGGGIAAWRVSSDSGSCSASAGCHSITLDARGGKTAASLVIHDSSVTMDTSKMSAAPSGKVYVLWQLPTDGQPTPMTEFTAGNGKPVTTHLKAAYSDTTAFAVSVEPASIVLPSKPHSLLASGVAT